MLYSHTRIIKQRSNKMKKINPKVTTLVVMLLSLLIAGGIAVDDAISPISPQDDATDSTGIF